MSRTARTLVIALIAFVLCELVTVAALLLAASARRPSALVTPAPATPSAAARQTPEQVLINPTQERSQGSATPTDLPSPTVGPGPNPPAAIATPAPAPTASPPPFQALSKYGLHLLLDDGRNHWLPEVWPQHVQAARQFVGEGGFVVQLIRLDDLDVERWQLFLDQCAEQHLVPIIRLATPFDHDKKWWEAPPTDPGGTGYTQVARQYRDFLAQLRWPATPRYAIVHNEPNRGDEWSNRPDPAEYARFLRDVGAALHTIGVTVLGPALDLYAPHSNGQPIHGYVYIDAESFLDGMYAAVPEAFDQIDVWAAHAYPPDPFRFDPARQFFRIDYANGATNPNHQEPPPGIYNRGINSYRWELWKLEQLIGPRTAGLPVMITESGWRHAPSQVPEARDAVHAEISFETMSAYLDLAFHGNGGRYPDLPDSGWTPWSQDPQVLGVVLFALGGYPRDWGHTNWVVVDQQGRITQRYPLTLGR